MGFCGLGMGSWVLQVQMGLLGFLKLGCSEGFGGLNTIM